MAGIMQLKRLFGGVEMKNNIRIEWIPESNNMLIVNFTKNYFPYYIELSLPAGRLQVKLDATAFAQYNIRLAGSGPNEDYELQTHNISWYFDNEEESYFVINLSELDAEGIESVEDIEVNSCLCFDFIGHLEE